MKNLVAAAAIVLGAAFATSSAEAAPITYSLSGTFENSSYYSGPADGGSFSGTFSASGLPITPPDTGYSYVYLDSFDIALKDSLGNTVFTFQSGVSGVTGYLSAAYETAFAADYLSFYDGSGNYFFLLLPPGFTGSGAILPDSNGYVSNMEFGGSDNTQVNLVASGSIAVSSAVVTAPEPATVALFGAAMFGVFLLARRRRSVTTG